MAFTLPSLCQMLTVLFLFCLKTVVDPDLDIGENLTKKMKESKNEALQRVVGLEGGIVPSEVKASIANSTDWVC